MTSTINIQKPMKILKKIVFVGDQGVGKSAFIQQFVNGKFSDKQRPSIGLDFYTKTITVNGGSQEMEWTIQLWDTGGRDSFGPPSIYRGADGVFLLYDITRKNTFEEVVEYKNSLHTILGETACMMLIGTKLDVVERMVTTEEGKELAQSLGIPFSEISSKERTNIDNAVQLLAKAIMEKYPDMHPLPKEKDLLDEKDSSPFSDTLSSMFSSSLNWLKRLIS